MAINANIFRDMESLLGKGVSHEERMAGNKAIQEKIFEDNKYVNKRVNVIDDQNKIQGYGTSNILNEGGEKQERSFTMQHLMSYHDQMLGKGTSTVSKAIGYGVPGVAALGLAAASNNESNRGDALGAGILGSGAAVIGGALAMAGFGRVAEANIGKIARGVIDQSKKAEDLLNQHAPGVMNTIKDFTNSAKGSDIRGQLTDEGRAARADTIQKESEVRSAEEAKLNKDKAEYKENRAPTGTGTPPLTPSADNKTPAFIPSHEWQPTPTPGTPLPMGGDYELPLDGSQGRVRWPDMAPKPTP